MKSNEVLTGGFIYVFLSLSYILVNVLVGGLFYILSKDIELTFIMTLVVNVLVSFIGGCYLSIVDNN